jgi:hypothetical protein
MSHSKSFAYNTLTVRVESDEPAHLMWLEEFLTPSFALVEGVKADCTAVLVGDDRSYDEILRRGPQADGQQVECFSLDGGLIRLPLWASTGKECVIFDQEAKVFYFVNGDRSQIRILAAKGNRAARVALMRVVREFAMTQSWTSQSLVIHGAAVVVGKSGIIIAGPKYAGKTSLLIYCLQAAGVRFVSNDRVVVDLKRSKPILRGMPTIVTIRDRMLDLFPAMEKRLLQGRCNHHLALSEMPQEGVQVVRRRGGSITHTPAQFCTLLNVGMRGQSPVRTLLLPRVTEDGSGLRVRELSSQEAGKRLTGALFAVGSSHKTSQMFALASHRPCIDQATLHELCLTLTTQVRCFDCQLGRQAYQQGAALTDFIKLVLRGNNSASGLPAKPIGTGRARP